MPSTIQDAFSREAISAEAVLARAEDENSAHGADGENFDVIFVNQHARPRHRSKMTFMAKLSFDLMMIARLYLTFHLLVKAKIRCPA